MGRDGHGIVARRKVDQNSAAVDPWTLVHFSTGLALGLMETSFAKVMGAAVAYELVEQYAERQAWGRDLFETSGPESPMNAVVDLAVFGAGHVLGRMWNRT